MKALSAGNNSYGFSTVELMLALAIITLVLGAAVLADFSAQYWIISSQTSNEALYHAKTKLEDLRATAKEDFYQVLSSPKTQIDDPTCLAGGLCYFVETAISDLSSCSKYAVATLSWQVPRYQEMTTSLPTNFSNPPEAVNLGGDCVLNQPAGVWTSLTSLYSYDFAPGNPTGIDAQDSRAYISWSSAPFIKVANSTGFLDTTPCALCTGPYNAIDVAHDEVTGRTYAYVASSNVTKQLQIIDLTDTASPTLAGSAALAGVDPLGSFPQGWRITIYDRKVYITTRETAGPELHIFDVGDPGAPVELGNKELNTSVYGIVVRDQLSGGAKHRFAYLATTRDPYELMVLDVTSPASITEITGAHVDLPGSQAAKSVFTIGNLLYLGRDSVSSGPDLYVFNAADPPAASGGLPQIGSAEIGGGVTSIRVSGAYAFLATTKSGSEVQVLKSDPALLSPISSYAVTNLAETGLDLNGDYLYVVTQISPRLRVIKSNP